MRNLEAGLGTVLRRGGGADVDPNAAPLGGILSPSDEFRMWAELAGSTQASADHRDLAAAIIHHFEPLREPCVRVERRGVGFGVLRPLGFGLIFVGKNYSTCGFIVSHECTCMCVFL